MALGLVGCPKGGATGTSSAATPVVYAWAPSASSPSPELLGSLMDQFYPVKLLLSVTRTGDQATVTVASGDASGQDACAATTTFTVPVGADGTFGAKADRISFTASGLAGSLHQAELSGALADGSLKLGKVAGLVDTREYLALLGSGPDDALCSMMPAMGDCQACPDGAARCWPVSFAEAAPQAVSVAVVPRTPEEVCQDPACSSSLACK